VDGRSIEGEEGEEGGYVVDRPHSATRRDASRPGARRHARGLFTGPGVGADGVGTGDDLDEFPA
jgi:hypothetical protein